MRGTADVGEELADIIAAANAARQDSLLGSWRTLFLPAHGKQAAAAIPVPLFQQYTGMNAIMCARAVAPSTCCGPVCVCRACSIAWVPLMPCWVQRTLSLLRS